MDKYQLKTWIKSHEGFSSKPYICSAGKLTIGFGRNIQDNGISFNEAELMLDNDINTAEKELLKYDWYFNSPPNIKDALINMCFNMGITRLLGFKKMITAIEKKDYTNAAIESLDSKWAKQVGNRAKDIAIMIRQG